MLPSREVIQLENQRFYVSNNVSSSSRQLNSKQETSDLVINNISQSSNIMQGIGSHIPVTNTTSAQCAGQNNTSVYNGFYSSSTFNSINNFEASLQWLTESRIPNNGLLDKNINCSSHSTPSHSCCVNRLAGVENIGMCSPLPGDSFRSGRETVNFQTKPPALSVNMMDSVQNWFNLPPLPNQQYSSKFNDPSMSCSQMNLPVIDQTDLKQNEVCLQITDSYFETPLNNSNSGKQLNGNNINEINNKIPDINDTSSVKSYNNSYQPNIISREAWKPPIQTAASYISSPTLFNSLNDSPEHYLYSLPPAVTSASSYCMIGDNVTTNISSKMTQNSCSTLHHNNCDKQVNSRLASCAEVHNNQTKVTSQGQVDPTYSTSNNIANRNERTLPFIDHRKVNTNSNTSQIPSSCNIKSCENNSSRKFGEESSRQYSSVFMATESNASVVQRDENSRMNQKNVNELPVNENKNNVVEITDETTSGSDESNIIVEESDEETESVVSIEEMKKGYISEEPVELRCLVCNVKTSTQTPATQFIHMNDSFPLTTASKTPVALKLIQILPTDLQHFLKLRNSFMCRRCLNLIETVEVLEVKLTSVKQTLSENFSKTVQYFLPATPIVEIENGTAKIIDKEIIVCIDNSNEVDTAFPGSVEPTRNSKEDSTNCDTLKEAVEESEGEFEQDEEEEEEDDEIVSGGEDGNDLEGCENSKENVEEQSEVDGVQCKICMKVLSSVKKCKWHMQLHTKQFSYYCEICGKGFNLKHSLEKHVMSHDDENRYQCDICGKTYKQRHRLNGHLKRHLGEFKMQCKDCGKGFVEKAAMEEHMLSHTKERTCICEVCGAKFGRQSNLKAHLQICIKMEVQCDLCTEVFNSKIHLKKHKVMSHGFKPSVECEVCRKVFVNAKDLKPHMRSHSNEKPYVCKLCGKRYKSVGNLNHHSKQHDASKLLKCTFCNELFPSKKLLDAHTNKHTGEHVFKCKECGKEFFKQRALQFHVMQMHSDTVELKSCHVCGKKFRKGLQVHMRTHTGARPYVCNICGSAFTVNSALNRHAQAKHQGRFES